MDDADLSILRHVAAIRDVTLDLPRRVPDEWLLRPNEGDWTPAHAFTHTAAGSLPPCVSGA